MRFTPLALLVAALVAFAANSLLCRLALGGNTIDPASFSSLRLLAGALTLGLLVGFRGNWAWLRAGGWGPAVALAAYAVPFSFAYLRLSAATGALILFAAVQATMLGWAIVTGERLVGRQWAGLAIAIGGLVYLLLPGVAAPPLTSAMLMGAAGAAWGLYSLAGRGAQDPLGATASNFIRALPLALLVSALTWSGQQTSTEGVVLAATSGAIASGLGYAVWYLALRHITTGGAATAQLAVPALAAWGGVVLLEEPLTMRLVIAATLILGGVGLALSGRAGRP